MRQIPPPIQLSVSGIENLVRHKGAQELVVTGAPVVRARNNRVDDSQASPCCDSLIGRSPAGPYDSIAARGMLERPHDGRADGNYAPALAACVSDRRRRRLRYLVRLVEGQSAC